MASDPDESVITAMALPTFQPPAALPMETPRLVGAALAQSFRWQSRVQGIDIGEIAATSAGIEHGRMAELRVDQGNAGEQVGLAATAARDFHRWLASTPGDLVNWGGPAPELPAPSFATMRGMGARAAAEQIAHYCVSTAHVLGNLTLRAFLIDPDAQSLLRDDEGLYVDAEGFPPFTDKRGTRPSFNGQLLSNLRKEARYQRDDDLTTLVETLGRLISDDAWVAMTSRRNEDYHRFRPQSVPGGVPNVNPWTREDGAR